MPTLAQLLAAIGALGATLAGGFSRVIAFTGSAIADLAKFNAAAFDSLRSFVVDALASLLADILASLQGPPGGETATLPDIQTNVTNVYNSLGGDDPFLTLIYDMLQTLDYSVPHVWTSWTGIDLGNAVEASGSGWYAVEASDGVHVSVVSVPPTMGCEVAGTYRRYPHLGWILPTISGDGVYGDLAYLGPEEQTLSWSGIRHATGFWLYLRPGCVVNIEAWTTGRRD